MDLLYLTLDNAHSLFEFLVTRLELDKVILCHFNHRCNTIGDLVDNFRIIQLVYQFRCEEIWEGVHLEQVGHRRLRL